MITKLTQSVFVIFFLLGFAGAANAASLRNNVTVTGPVVTLGDVLTGAGKAASVQIANSPAPGQRMMLSAGVIGRIAVDNDVKWENPYDLSAVAVTRAGKQVSHTAIEAGIADAIKAQGDESRKSIQLSATQGALYVPVNAPDTVNVTDMNYNAGTGMFTATLALPTDGGQTASATVTGRATDVVRIPVLNRSISRGEVINKRDIEWTDISPNRAQGSVISDAVDLIGKAARRPLRAEIPLRSNDVQEPILVGKNTMVTLVAATPNLVLTTVGRSLDEGGKGDVIRVMNNHSHKVIEGTVLSSGQVRVEISSRFAALSH